MLIWAIFSSGGFLLALSSEKETQVLLSSKPFEMLRIICKTSIPSHLIVILQKILCSTVRNQAFLGAFVEFYEVDKSAPFPKFGSPILLKSESFSQT